MLQIVNCERPFPIGLGLSDVLRDSDESAEPDENNGWWLLIIILASMTRYYLENNIWPGQKEAWKANKKCWLGVVFSALFWCRFV